MSRMRDNENHASDWRDDWRPLIERIGQDLFRGPADLPWGTDSNTVAWGPDRVDASSLRRYLEPLEFDCRLHTDAAIARANGYPDVIAPVTALVSYTMQPVWRPGSPSVFTSHERNAQPSVGPAGDLPRFPGAPPRYSAYFGTDFELHVVRPAVLGERLGRRGSRLLEVIPKETSVGRGAFVKWETEIVVESLEVIARFITQVFAYEPRQTDS